MSLASLLTPTAETFGTTVTPLGSAAAVATEAAERGAEAAGGIGPVRTVLVIAFVAIGAFFLLVGTVGLLRLPNVYNRMHATTKATTLGASSIAVAAWVFHGPAGDGLLALVTVLFLFVTAPTGAHLISRSAERMGIEFEEGVTWPGRTDRQPNQPSDD